MMLAGFFPVHRQPTCSTPQRCTLENFGIVQAMDASMADDIRASLAVSQHEPDHIKII